MYSWMTRSRCRRVEALVAQCPHPALRVRVRARRPHRGADHTHAFAAEDVVKAAAVLAVAVTDQERGLHALVFERHHDVPRLLGVGCLYSDYAPEQGNRYAVEERPLDDPTVVGSSCAGRKALDLVRARV